MEAVQAMLESQQNKLDSQSSQFFSQHASYTPFRQQPIEEKSELEKSIEAMQEAEREFQEMLASPISQYFHESYSLPPLQNDQSSVLDTSMSSCVSPIDILKTWWTYHFSRTKLHILLFQNIQL